VLSVVSLSNYNAEYEDGLEKFFLPDKPTIASWLVGMASAGVFVAVGILYAMHLFLICQDKTTNEDVTKN